jgi:Mannosyltransferase (PIG-V)
VTAAPSALRATLLALLASRAVILVMLGLTVALLTPGVSLTAALLHWDAVSFLQIASHGYPARTSYLDAFLPGFPLLVAGVSVLTRDAATAALLVCVVAEAVALWFLFRLVRQERDVRAAWFCVLMLAFFPTAVFLSAPFTEAPFIAAAAAALWLARGRRPVAACCAAMFAAAFRLTGLALLPALALEMLMQGGWRPRREMLALVLIPLPLLLYCAYMALHTGDALALFKAEQSASFGQSPAAPWTGLATTWNTMVTATDGETRSIFAREIAFGLLGFVASVAMWISTRIPASFALYCSVAWLMTASISFWRSEPRYILALFPALMLLGDLTSRRMRALRPALVAASAVLMCLGTIVFAQGRWLG